MTVEVSLSFVMVAGGALDIGLESWLIGAVAKLFFVALFRNHRIDLSLRSLNAMLVCLRSTSGSRRHTITAGGSEYPSGLYTNEI